MKKIAKLTWLHNGNYGSILQAYALSHFLQEHGYEVVDIDYSASMKTKLINWWKNKNSPGLFLKKLEARKWKKKVDANLIQKRNELFDKFRTNELNLSKRCSTIEEIKQETNKFDVVICGSDQIWSPALLNPVYYLDMVSDKKKKIAYAPSFGVLEMTEKKRKQIIGYLKRIDYISVREYQGQELVKKLIGKEVPVLVDPTMLLPQNHWKRFSNNKVLDKPYLFVYLLTPNEKYINMVKQIAEQKNLDVVIVPTGKGPFDTGFIELFDIGPTEWISLIASTQ